MVCLFLFRICIEFRKCVKMNLRGDGNGRCMDHAFWGDAPARLDPEMPGGSVRKYSTAGQYRECWRESMRRESRRVLSFRAVVNSFVSLVIHRRIVLATSSNNFSIKIQSSDSNRLPKIHWFFLSNSAKVVLIPLRISRSAHKRISVIVRITPRCVGKYKHPVALFLLFSSSFYLYRIKFYSLLSFLCSLFYADTCMHFAFPRKDRRTVFPRGYYASGIVSLLHNELCMHTARSDENLLSARVY